MNSTLNINWEQLALVIGEVDCPADEEMKDLYRMYVDDAGQRLRALAAQSADRTLVAKEAHKIRGAASSFGFEHLAILLRTIEAEIGSLSPARLDELIDEATCVFAHSVNEIQGRYPGLSA
jgi:HPt (histidine-containing phosphotransfer) domain-containing protein